MAVPTPGPLRCLKGGPPIKDGDLLCFAVTRNEMLRLPDVLRHHRELGVDHFIVVDNGSDDGTLDLLVAQDDADVYAADGSFAASRFGFDWLHPLLDEFGTDHWVLAIDSDELFVYPHSEHATLRDLCKHVEASGCDSVFALLLDMYSDRSIAATSYTAGERLIDACPYFDPGPYQVARDPVFPTFELAGGARARVFWTPDLGYPPPTVSKVPLVKWRPGYRYISSCHYMQPSPQKLAAVSGALLHFKFLSDFHQRAVTEAARGEHFEQGREYKMYLQRIAADPGLSLFVQGSARYRDTAGLVALQICRTSPEWERAAQQS